MVTIFDAPPGALVRVAPATRRIVAPNPGAFTFTGTCSYILGDGDVAIVDPGPAIDSHVEALLAAIEGERLRYILVTHTHRDHSPAARLLQARTGAVVAGCAAYAPPPDLAVTGPGLDAAHDRDYAPDRVLADGETIAFGGLAIETVATPGHTTNHLCFALRETGALFTGDHVMGWATTVIAPPDGAMGDYLASMEKLRARGDTIYWPAHGGPVLEPQRYARALMHHRRQREQAILQRLEAGDETIPIIVARIYEGTDSRLHGAAALSVFAHLEDLVERGLARCDGAPTPAARYFKTE
ncbi:MULTISPECIES: MBL fold metallo-hydrolase [Methylosinus]|uniref:MBL fold metallo-hydrolase n=1 Tax=Methylosinus trichosporium (strain ATCC 35070 / NCIMB 11131 / UNIQEM 75 / OB3b) TaxID=595536 RepID=A0A2D2CVL9_METT3|nr:MULTISPECIES: MBL fold metallo-hydrolase [Methylosinus]ATQ66818.1 MBL fold metallo-hydrolase [Methylosinus trichosporium OB3b]OBS50635.1 MBL fold metallo-hydrolase [Methylosinus sp. 3S-1]